MDRRELVERAGRGDHDAFALLATAASSRLDAPARLILHDSELARDAVENAPRIAGAVHVRADCARPGC